MFRVTPARLRTTCDAGKWEALVSEDAHPNNLGYLSGYSARYPLIRTGIRQRNIFADILLGDALASGLARTLGRNSV